MGAAHGPRATDRTLPTVSTHDPRTDFDHATTFFSNLLNEVAAQQQYANPPTLYGLSEGPTGGCRPFTVATVPLL